MSTTRSANLLIVELRSSLDEFELLMDLFDEARLMLLWQSKIPLSDISEELRYSVVERTKPLLRTQMHLMKTDTLHSCLRAEMMSILELFMQ